MKIATWNINSVRIRLDSIKKLEKEHSPDIILLQETKVENHLFPSSELESFGYIHQYYEGQKSYNGVAILSKLPFDEKFSLVFCKDDKRHLCIKVKDIEIHNFYIPAGGDIPDVNVNPKFKHKLEYLAQMKEWFLSNRSKNDKIVIAGDLNIAPHEQDVWSSKALRNEVSHTDIERAMMVDIIESMSWNDVARSRGNEEKIYSWWSYRNIDWKKSNRGRRLDHIWLSKAMESKFANFYIETQTRGWERASDHVPVMIDLL
ncbi:MAG: exodeoxyribonuclease III [Alphaproteobacteria bacterium]|nr:exodeoxyribonuclease III [Alphaproteobacteria bacterium]